ncbi:MAG: hypothetical protein MJY87_11660 [Fibrobacter sp.]|nr:hypothetical protein [Fibrobacter sp.]
MSQRSGLGHFLSFIAMALAGLFSVSAWARNMESIPVWNPVQVARPAVEPEKPDTAGAADSLETHGYKTMEITVGDGGTQVDQELRLSITGKLSDSVFIDALLSDVGRKAGDQTTATLREVDQIYFRVEAPFGFLHLGDLTWLDQSLSLYSLDRSSLGAMAGIRGEFLNGRGEVRGVVGADEVEHFSRTMKVVSGQREGYSMDEGGSFVAVVPQSETVWLNGKKLQRGVDYAVNYAGGLIDFKGGFVMTSEDEIRVEYDAYDDNNVYTLYGAQGQFRHENLWLDVSGFRLENDVDRLKRGVWTDDDYDLIRHDRGDEFVRSDTLDALVRPRKTERAGARIRTQLNHQFFADFEFAVNREDSNTVSHDVGGPQGAAFRWFVTSDSTRDLKHFPVAVNVSGSRIQQGFDLSKFQGSSTEWSSYLLRDSWDIDASDSSFYQDDLLLDEFAIRFRLGKNFYGSADWGYRRNEDEKWNSSRTSLSFSHVNSLALSEVSLVRVVSVQDETRERYQALFSSEFLQGVFRPYGSLDLRYTEISEGVRAYSAENPQVGSFAQDVMYGKSAGGFGLYLDRGFVKETVGGRMARRRIDGKGEWQDSLKASTWLQEAQFQSRYLTVSHLLQFEQKNENATGAENSWVGNLTADWGDIDEGISGSVSYKLGLTEEQVYTAVYKAVAPGTGDVRYDSLTGAYIEGVDDGDFVYEGMGRNDSVGAVLSSDVSFGMDVRWNPARSLGIKNGFLRDITLGGAWSGEGNDTTGKKLYFPPVTKSGLNRLTSGNVTFEGLLEWEHPDGARLSYKPSLEYDKKLSSISYHETIWQHLVEGGYRISLNHLVEGSFLMESEELSALQVWDWDVYDGSLKYRFDFLQSFYVQPLGRYRNGSGEDERGASFGGDLWEGALRLGYNRLKKVDAFANFSVIYVNTHGEIVPYQVMDSYRDGTTYRLEVSASVDINDFISMGGRYILRFGDAEENIFQKLSMEARANF